MFAPASPWEAFQHEGSDVGIPRRPSLVGTVMAVLVVAYLMLGFGLFFTCIMATFQHRGQDSDAKPWCVSGTLSNGVLRILLVIAFVCIGYAVPHFREVMSIIASVCCSCNNVFFPLFFAYKLERQSSTPAKPTGLSCRARHAGIVVLALFCAIVGVHDSISKLIAKMAPAF